VAHAQTHDSPLVTLVRANAPSSVLRGEVAIDAAAQSSTQLPPAMVAVEAKASSGPRKRRRAHIAPVARGGGGRAASRGGGTTAFARSKSSADCAKSKNEEEKKRAQLRPRACVKLCEYMRLQYSLGRAWLQKRAESARAKRTGFSNIRILRGCGGALPPREATTETRKATQSFKTARSV
jgi:hypothetical protein